MSKKLSSGSDNDGTFGKGEERQPSDRNDDKTGGPARIPRSNDEAGSYTRKRIERSGERKSTKDDQKPFRPGFRKPPREDGDSFRGSRKSDGDRKFTPRDKRDGERTDSDRSEKPFSRKRFEDSRGPMERPAAPRKPRPAPREDGDFKPKRPYEKREGSPERPPSRNRFEDSRGPFERNDGPRKPRPAAKDGDDFKSKRPYEKRGGSAERPPARKRFEDSHGPSERNDGPRKPRPAAKDGDDFKGKRPYEKREGGTERTTSRKRFEDGSGPMERPAAPRKPRATDTRNEGKEFGERKPFSKRSDDRHNDDKRSERPEKPFARKRREDDDRSGQPDRPKRKTASAGPGRKPFAGIPLDKKSREDHKRATYTDEPAYKPRKAKPQIEDEAEYYGDNDQWEVNGDKRAKPVNTATYPMPLNKYIAHSGECSRRDAAELVKQGKAKVNGELITDPGHKVNEDDKITLSGKKLTPQKGLVYILLNKPKGFITTSEDERGRRTVMDLVASAEAGRVYPVGRLDRATTGLLLLTNDGVLAQKLSHPSHNVKKVYHVTLDKPLTKADFDKIVAGVELEDGKAQVDEIAYLDKKNELGLEIHSGKNRIVRRIFESMGYVVDKLDRMMYAGLTKKNLPRGKWRFLDERETVLLKHFKS